MNRVRRLLCGVLLAPGVFATGCIPYAYPKLSFVPSCDLGPDATDTHAFRLDLTADTTLLVPERGEYTLSEITPRPDGSIPPQSRVTVERGVFFLTQLGRLHTTRVRLYRPGYQLVEL